MGHFDFVASVIVFAGLMLLLLIVGSARLKRDSPAPSDQESPP
jgi:hypothetical protein